MSTVSLVSSATVAAAQPAAAVAGDGSPPLSSFFPPGFLSSSLSSLAASSSSLSSPSSFSLSAQPSCLTSPLLFQASSSAVSSSALPSFSFLSSAASRGDGGAGGSVFPSTQSTGEGGNSITSSGGGSQSAPEYKHRTFPMMTNVSGEPIDIVVGEEKIAAADVYQWLRQNENTDAAMFYLFSCPKAATAPDSHTYKPRGPATYRNQRQSMVKKGTHACQVCMLRAKLFSTNVIDKLKVSHFLHLFSPFTSRFVLLIITSSVHHFVIATEWFAVWHHRGCVSTIPTAPTRR